MQQTAKEFLQQIEKADLIIKNKSVELYQLKCLVTSTTAPLRADPVQSSGTSDKVGRITSKMIDLQNEINELIDQYIDDKQSRIEIIEQVKDPVQYKILHMRYVQYKKLSDIAKELHFSETWVAKIHGRGLYEVQKLLNCKKEYRKVQKSTGKFMEVCY